jgi:hypothetical protein
MNIYKLFIYLSLFSKINTQIISMTLCSDYYCSDKCVSWTTNVDKCISYQSNLGSILTIDSITLYSDSECKKSIPGREEMTMFIDTGCKTLYASNDNKIGSYKSMNISAIIGSVSGFVILFMCICICNYYKNLCIYRVAPAPIPNVIVLNPYHTQKPTTLV